MEIIIEDQNLLAKKIQNLRKEKNLTQREVADKLGVSEQAVSKWETGETMPDLERCRKLAEIFEDSLDDLANYEPIADGGLGVPPKGKHIFGVVTVGEKGQIVIPAKARKLFSITAGDQLVVLGDESQGIALLKSDSFLQFADVVRKSIKEGKHFPF